MILPTEHVSPGGSLLGAGALILSHLRRPLTATALWDLVRGRRGLGSFKRFVLALDLLYALGAVDVVDGVLHSRGARTSYQR